MFFEEQVSEAEVLEQAEVSEWVVIVAVAVAEVFERVDFEVEAEVLELAEVLA